MEYSVKYTVLSSGQQQKTTSLMDAIPSCSLDSIHIYSKVSSIVFNNISTEVVKYRI